MNIAILSSIFFFSMVKFMFAAVPGAIYGLPIWQTYLANVLGGLISATIFYFFAEAVVNYSDKRKAKKHQELIARGEIPKAKKTFTRGNKFVVKIKGSLGIYGIAFLAPLFLSIPLGSMITAKFYGKRKDTIFIIYLGIFINGCFTTGIPYLFS